MGRGNSKNTQGGSSNAKESGASKTGEISTQGMEEAIVRQAVNALEPAAAIVDGIKFARNEIDSAIDYEKSLHGNYDRLDKEAKELYQRRDELVDRPKSYKSKQASKECQEWIDEVHNIEKEVCLLNCKYIEELEHHQLKHFMQRSNLSETILRMCGEVHSCWERGSVFLTEALVDKPPERVIKKKKSPNIENLPSLRGIVDEILGYFLRHKDVKRIGLWGKVGVGKTATLENLNNNEKVAELFDLVIFATLADEGNEEMSQSVEEKLKRAKENLQLQIAERLNIEGVTDPKTIACRISEKLKSTRYLLILDEVWRTFSLEDIGIEENEEDSKVVLASRHHNICIDMDVGKTIKVKPLLENEALRLFFEKLDRKMNQPDIDPMAVLVVEECGYLPMLIDRVARTFKMIENTEEQQQQRQKSWQDALNRLQQFDGMDSNGQFDGMDEFLMRLRYCYKELDNEKKQKCFLYGALYPRGYEIYENHLLECWNAENLTVRNGGRSMLRYLIAVSLLEDGEKMKHIRMNKILRSLALNILSESKDSRYLVRAGEILIQPPGEEEWNGVKWISLMDSNLSSLPGNPGCNNLSTLLLQGNDDLTMIPDSFFLSMQNLHVLNLRGTNITTLPASISCLKDLRVLYLNSCNQLEKLPPTIAELRDKLEVLDMRDTRIDCLPGEIKDLHQLRCLRMSLSNLGGEARNMNIDQEVISKLFSLEELLIEVDAQNGLWNELLISVSKKLATLKKLNRNARHFQISIGKNQSISVIDDYENKTGRCLRYANGEGASRAISEVLAGADAFQLIGHSGRFKLSDFGINHISRIKSCVIESCPEMETIIHSADWEQGILECLEKMSVRDLPKLGSIWDGVVPSGSLAKLTTLSFSKCSKLKKIFTRDMIQQLAKLQHLEVRECEEIKDIVESANNGPEAGELPSLKRLTLHNLPILRCNWTANLLRIRSLEMRDITECPLLQELPSQ